MSWIKRVRGWFRRDRDSEPKGKRLYAGAKHDRRTDGWIATGSGANAELATSLVKLRKRSRQQKRDNSYARNMFAQLASYMSGIMPRSAIQIPPDVSDAERKRLEGLNRQIDDRFKAWSKECNARGRGNFRGLQFQAVMGMLESGETFTRKRIRRLSDGLAVPLQIELLEADYCDHTKDEDLKSGGWIVQGIEHDPIGRVSAYHMFRVHPHESTLLGSARLLSPTETVAVPADSVAHLYPMILVRPGQARGEPWLHANLINLNDFAGYLDAERVRLRAAASVMGAVRTVDQFTFEDEDPMNSVGINPIRDSKGCVIERIAPGEIAYLQEGQDITWNSPPKGDGFKDYVNTDLHGQAAGALMPYEMYTGDLSETNYSSIMFGMGGFKRLASRFLSDVVVALWGDPVWSWFIEAGKAAGVLPSEAGPVLWVPEPFPIIDPVREGRGNLIAVRAGAKTLQRWIIETGEDPEEILREHEAIVDWASRNGIALDGIPTTSTLAGQAQEDFSVDSTSGNN